MRNKYILCVCACVCGGGGYGMCVCALHVFDYVIYGICVVCMWDVCILYCGVCIYEYVYHLSTICVCMVREHSLLAWSLWETIVSHYT